MGPSPELMPEGWEWDETLYAGSAQYYERGRLPYPADLADRLASALGLDGSGRLLDVGCGPGIIALRLAHVFDDVVGVDADRQMLAQATQRASERKRRPTRVGSTCAPRIFPETLAGFVLPRSPSRSIG